MTPAVVSPPTWTAQVLELEETQFGPEAVAAAWGELVALAEPIRDRVARVREVRNRLAWVAQAVFRGAAVRFRAQSPSTDFTLTDTVRARAGNCVGLTSVFLAVADLLGVPARGLLLEGHILVCHDDDRDPAFVEVSRGGVFLNPRTAGQAWSDQWPRRRVLSPDELVAVHLSNRAAFVAAPDGRNEEAIRLLDAALKLFPDYTGARINRVVALRQVGRAAEAVQDLARLRESPNLGPRYALVIDQLLAEWFGGRARGERGPHTGAAPAVAGEPVRTQPTHQERSGTPGRT